jgi:hypothetical protein
VQQVQLFCQSRGGDQLDLDARQRRLHRLGHLDGELCGRMRGAHQPQLAAPPACCQAYLRGQFVEVIEDVFGFRRKVVPSRGQLDTARGTDEECRAQRPLQALDMHRDRLLRQMQPPRGAGDVQRARYCDK